MLRLSRTKRDSTVLSPTCVDISNQRDRLPLQRGNIEADGIPMACYSRKSSSCRAEHNIRIRHSHQIDVVLIDYRGAEEKCEAAEIVEAGRGRCVIIQQCDIE